MDSYRGNLVPHEPANSAAGSDDDDFAGEPPPVSVGQDERRMQVRAYNYWASLLGDRPVPQIADLTGAALPDFADHAVMLDFSQGTGDPAMTMVGTKLAEECGMRQSIARLSEVPAGSLLSRITDRYLQILANAAPIGFEAEFVNQRGTTLLYRGILLPFSGAGEDVAHVMAVINWKELADPIVTAELRHELENAVGAAHLPVSGPQLPTWADGPVAPEQSADAADRGLAAARAAAGEAHEMDKRSRTALYLAIGRAWDFALAEQPRAPLDAVVNRVFGDTYCKRQLAEFNLALAHAERLGLGHNALSGFLAGTPGGLKHMVGTERRLRRADRTV